MNPVAEDAFHLLALIVLGLIAVVILVALVWALRWWRIKSCVLLACGLALAGCSDDSRTRTQTVEVVRFVNVPVPTPRQTGDQAPRVLLMASGPLVSYPEWLDLTVNAAFKQAMIDEISTVQPEPDPRGFWLAGVPSRATVIVLDPGPFYSRSSPTGLAMGETDLATDTIYVAWRSTPSGPVLPALAHELRHLHTNDPLAGH